jgi:hypothetical protein
MGPTTAPGAAGIPLCRWVHDACMAVPHNDNRRHGTGQRRLSLLEQTPTGGCMAQAKVCALTCCRYHLGGERTTDDGHAFRCALDAANSYPHGLPPSVVAMLLGVTESECQSTERAALRRVAVGMQRLKNDEAEGARQARHKARTGRPAPAMPIPPLAPTPPAVRPKVLRRRPQPAPVPLVASPPSSPDPAATLPLLDLDDAPRSLPRPRQPRPGRRRAAPSALPVVPPVDPRQLALWPAAAE